MPVATNMPTRSGFEKAAEGILLATTTGARDPELADVVGDSLELARKARDF